MLPQVNRVAVGKRPAAQAEKRSLFLSAVTNGVIAVPIMVVMMLMAMRADIMGPFVITRRLTFLGWLATAAMAMAMMVLAMLATWRE